METVGDLFTSAVRADPTRPLLTFYDDHTGERTELSGATLANWVAKTANLLVDGLGLGVGDRAVVLLAAHWQTAAVLLGCWSAGLSINTDEGTAGDVAFVAPERASSVTYGDRFVVNQHPLGLPSPSVPPGYGDYTAEVRGQGDQFTAPDWGADVPSAGTPPTDTSPAGTSPTDTSPAGGGVPAERFGGQARLCRRATDRATEWGISSNDRVLIDVDLFSDPLDWLLAPLSARASIVLCRALNADRLASRIDTEKITNPMVTIR